jgi:Cysteine rich repeat
MHCNICLALAAVLVLSGTALAAEPEPPPALLDFKGTPEEQAACAPDAKKFCRDDIPDTFRVLACLQENREKLKKACLGVLESHGQ